MRSYQVCLAVAAALFLLPPACGGSVTETNSGEGGAGTTTTTATTTATGSGATTGSTTGTGGALDGGAPDAAKICGGKMGLQCGSDEWCSFMPPGSCGNADMTGTCEPRPDACTKDCPGVCGCDGAFHCNACVAHAAGVDVSDSKACFSNGKYSAQNLYTGVPRFAVFKADEVRDICVRIVLEPSASGSPGLAPPQGWQISKAEITNRASDCPSSPNGGFPQPPADASVESTGGTGSMTLSYPDGPPTPCFVTVHGTLEFAPGSPWVPASEPLDADNVPVEGGCS